MNSHITQTQCWKRRDHVTASTSHSSDSPQLSLLNLLHDPDSLNEPDSLDPETFHQPLLESSPVPDDPPDSEDEEDNFPQDLDYNSSGSEIDGPCKIPYPGAARVESHGRTALDDFNDDRFAEERKKNLYYPTAGRDEWQLVEWLSSSSLSTAEIDSYLKLEMVSASFFAYGLILTLNEFLDKTNQPVIQDSEGAQGKN